LLFGGRIGNRATNELWEFNLATLEWTQIIVPGFSFFSFFFNYYLLKKKL